MDAEETQVMARTGQFTTTVSWETAVRGRVAAAVDRFSGPLADLVEGQHVRVAGTWTEPTGGAGVFHVSETADPREDGELTFGLLSRVSPAGRYVISTVKDRSVFVPIPDLMILQLFFPIKGILVVYDRETKTFSALPGADDPEYVQSNAVWSPDGNELAFARTKAHRAEHLEQKNSALVDEKDVPEFTVEKKPFRYDLYRIPFNDAQQAYDLVVDHPEQSLGMVLDWTGA